MIREHFVIMACGATYSSRHRSEFLSTILKYILVQQKLFRCTVQSSWDTSFCILDSGQIRTLFISWQQKGKPVQEGGIANVYLRNNCIQAKNITNDWQTTLYSNLYALDFDSLAPDLHGTAPRNSSFLLAVARPSNSNF